MYDDAETPRLGVRLSFATVSCDAYGDSAQPVQACRCKSLTQKQGPRRPHKHEDPALLVLGPKQVEFRKPCCVGLCLYGLLWWLLLPILWSDTRRNSHIYKSSNENSSPKCSQPRPPRSATDRGTASQRKARRAREGVSVLWLFP